MGSFSCIYIVRKTSPLKIRSLWDQKYKTQKVVALLSKFVLNQVTSIQIPVYIAACHLHVWIELIFIYGDRVLSAFQFHVHCTCVDPQFFFFFVGGCWGIILLAREWDRLVDWDSKPIYILALPREFLKFENPNPKAPPPFQNPRLLYIRILCCVTKIKNNKKTCHLVSPFTYLSGCVSYAI